MRTSLCALLFGLALVASGCMTVGEGFGPDSDSQTDSPSDDTGAGDGDGGGAGDGSGGGAGDGDGGAGDGGGGGGGGGGGEPPPTGPTPATVMADFGACMTLADFEANGLGGLALTVSANGACTVCHGAQAPTLLADPTATFQAAKVAPSVSRWVEVGPDLVPTFNPIFIDKGLDAAHGLYTLDPAIEQGLQDFFLATEALYLAGNCPPAL